MKFLKTITNKLKGFWNIYGGIIASTFIAWLNDFSKTTMDTWTSYLVLTLTCISVLTFFKIMLFRQKSNGLADTAALSQQSVKVLKAAVDPVKQGEDLGQTIITTIQVVRKGSVIMEKLKNFVKWLWGNKLTLISIISNLVVSVFAQFILYTDALKDFEYFQVHDVVFKVVVTVLCLLWLANNIFTAVTKYGLESLPQLQERSEKLKKDTTDKLSASQKTALKADLSNFKVDLKKIVNAINEVVKAKDLAFETVEHLKTLSTVLGGLTQEQEQKLRDAENTVAVKQNELTDLENKKQDKLAQIEKIKNELKR